jgi:CheY-like chemotaxis protein
MDYCSMVLCHDPGKRVMLAVSDTGHGMSAETQSHLFEPFFTTKTQGKGTGLGLAMVYGAVKQNGGIMNVHSELGKGTVFKIYFPPSGGPRASDTELTGEGGALTGKNETVLLAEDNAMVLQFILDVLRSLGYHVIAASSGEEALAKAHAHEGAIDLLMTDIVMPRMNGTALAEALREKRPRIKVLFCSGYAENLPSLRESIKMGDGFIGKPFSAVALSRKLREMLALISTEERSPNADVANVVKKRRE